MLPFIMFTCIRAEFMLKQTHSNMNCAWNVYDIKLKHHMQSNLVILRIIKIYQWYRNVTFAQVFIATERPPLTRRCSW